MSAEDGQLAQLETIARDQGRLPLDARVDLHFALAKAYGDLGRHDASFSALLVGNTLKRKSVPYDEPAMMANLDRMASHWSPDSIAAWSGIGNADARPIFILGMPRSGSTLVEQILASHPAVSAHGETTAFYDAASAVLGMVELYAPLDEPEANRAQRLDQIARRYLATLGSIPAGALRITDKTPGNFAYIPLIRAVFPNARFIHTGRDALDTCVSCFQSLFTNVPFSYDLGELGRYHRAHDRLMDRWREVMPAGTILDVSYEALVADFEPEVRRILEFCGLPWNDACLAFHATERAVKTASAVQVRQPLYASSVGRARKIDPALLSPLRAALEA